GGSSGRGGWRWQRCNDVKQAEAEEAAESSDDTVVCWWRGRQQQRRLQLRGLKAADAGDGGSWNKMRAATGVRRDSTADVEQEQGRKTAPRGQWLRTNGGVPFLLEMPTTRREGTAAMAGGD
ncbi:hypothetical protein B296_00032041, partial [Ensete ventricosum]